MYYIYYSYLPSSPISMVSIMNLRRYPWHRATYMKCVSLKIVTRALSVTLIIAVDTLVLGRPRGVS